MMIKMPLRSPPILLVLSFLLGLLSAASLQASPVETFEFTDEVTKVRFQALSKELRCPKCQNQNLADSNSPIAADLRRELYELLQQGKADSEVVDFMVARYGEFVLYRPRVSSLTYILWFGPAIFLLIGVVVVIVILRKKNMSKEQLTLDPNQQAKLKQLLSASETSARSANIDANIPPTQNDKE